MSKKLYALALAAGVSFSSNLAAQSAPTQPKSSGHQLLRFYTCDHTGAVSPGLYTGMFSTTNGKTYSLNDTIPLGQGAAGINTAAVVIGGGNGGICCHQVGLYVENLTNQPGNGVQGMKIKQFSFTFISKRESTFTSPGLTNPDWYGPVNGPFVLAEFIDPSGQSADVFTVSNPRNQGIVDTLPPASQGDGQNNGNQHNVVFPTVSQGAFNGLDVPTSPNGFNGPGPGNSQVSPWTLANLGIMTTNNGSFFISNVKLNGVGLNFDTQNPTLASCIFDNAEFYDSNDSFGSGYEFRTDCENFTCGSTF